MNELENVKKLRNIVVIKTICRYFICILAGMLAAFFIIIFPDGEESSIWFCLFVFVFAFIIALRIENIIIKNKSLIDFRKAYYHYLVVVTLNNAVCMEQANYEPEQGIARETAKGCYAFTPKRYTSYGLFQLNYRGVFYEQAQVRNVGVFHMGRKDSVYMPDFEGTLIRIDLKNYLKHCQLPYRFTEYAQIHHKSPDCAFSVNGRSGYGDQQSTEFQQQFEVYSNEPNSIAYTKELATRVCEIQSHIKSQLEIVFRNQSLYILICHAKSPFTMPIIRDMEVDRVRVEEYLNIPKRFIDALLDEWSRL